MSIKLWATVGLLWLSPWQPSNSARAEDRYFLLVFASQGQPVVPSLSHTFALFVKTAGEGEDPSRHELESHCISWLPRTLVVEVIRLLPQPGKNLTLQETLVWARGQNARITMWGPFAIDKDLYDLGLKQVQRLNRGHLQYLCIDGRLRGQGASNCIHAVSDLDTKQAPLFTGTAFGEPASDLVVRHLSRWFLQSAEDHSWLIDRLDLKRFNVWVNKVNLGTPR